MMRAISLKSMTLLCSTAMVLGTAATASFAQDVTGLSDTQYFDLGTIIVRARDEHGNAADRATSVYVADAELDRARMGDVRDLFAGLASVSVGGGIPVAQKIFVNGVDMLNLNVTVDGVSQNNRIFHHASANAFDPGLMKSVRVDPGVAAADSGAFSMAGGVIMETVDPDDILDDGANFGGNLRTSYDSNGSTLQGALTLAGREGAFDYLIYGKRADGEDYTDGSGEVMTGTRADLTSGLVKLGYNADNGGRVEFSAQQMTDTGLRNDKANFGPNPTVVDPAALLVPYNTKRTVYALSYKANNDGAIWDPTVTLGFSETSVDKPQPYGSEGDTNTVSAKVENQFHLSSGGSVTAGVDFIKRRGDYQDPDPTWGGPFYEGFSNLGVFAQARLEPTAALSLSAGLRADFQRFEGETMDHLGSPYKDTRSGVSANLSASYEITPNTTLRGGYSNVFGGLQIEDNYTYWDDFDYAAIADARGENYVVGLDWTDGVFGVGGDIFKTKLTNVRNGGDVANFESKGINLYGTYDWASGYARVTASHSEVDSSIDSWGVSYETLDFGAPIGTVLAFELQQELTQWNLLVGGNIDWTFDYDTGHSSASVQEIPGYQVVNLFAEYSPPAFDNLTLRFEAKNIFDTEYADKASYGTDFVEGSFQSIKEPGRSFALTATTQF